MKKAAKMLRQNKYQVSEIYDELGYENLSSFIQYSSKCTALCRNSISSQPNRDALLYCTYGLAGGHPCCITYPYRTDSPETYI